ncbi:MAG: hypothetical protein KJ583_05145 [Nanoarchaeota archaeon]|nr:hypothetical protein [Nanoarchaeota archaeon]MBU1270360.1 hypothetical protein [Nanoarchaeota archaeon]MBU1604675.1 hypothetical protein [Nanoarchaeota archaeon]MBU2443357.1 hypothetical protein [Nanoarchaeota archaeon]
MKTKKLNKEEDEYSNKYSSMIKKTLSGQYIPTFIKNTVYFMAGVAATLLIEQAITPKYTYEGAKKDGTTITHILNENKWRRVYLVDKAEDGYVFSTKDQKKDKDGFDSAYVRLGFPDNLRKFQFVTVPKEEKTGLDALFKTDLSSEKKTAETLQQRVLESYRDTITIIR